MSEASIALLAERLSRLRNATVGRGPRHPIAPQPHLAEAIAEELRQFPRLAELHPDFVSFLDGYEGAAIIDPSDLPDYRTLLIFGVGEYYEGFSHPVDPASGLYVFAENIVRVAPGDELDPRCVFDVGYGFDVTGEGPLGVFDSAPWRAGEGTATRAGFGWCAASFSEWLDLMIRSDGRLAAGPARPAASNPE